MERGEFLPRTWDTGREARRKVGEEGAGCGGEGELNLEKGLYLEGFGGSPRLRVWVKVEKGGPGGSGAECMSWGRWPAL